MQVIAILLLIDYTSLTNSIKGGCMTPKEVRAYFKSGYNFGSKTGMSMNNLRNWDKFGYVPFKSQKKLEQITNGELKAQWYDVEPYQFPVKQE